MGVVHRLTPVMSSRRVQAMDFIMGYFASWGFSPSLSEIGAALGVSKFTAKDIVDQLVAAGLVFRVKGQARGLSLPNRLDQIGQAEMLFRLREMGWVIDPDRQSLIHAPPSPEIPHAPPPTLSPLARLPLLDHPPERDGGGSD